MNTTSQPSAPYSAGISGIWIDGEFVDPEIPQKMTRFSPADGTVVAEIGCGGVAEAHGAVEAAAYAQLGWGRRAPSERCAVLRSVADALRESTTTDLPELICRETGKRLAEARAEVELSAAYFEWFSQALAVRHAEVWESRPGVHHMVTEHPLGVVAVMTPWNFPLSIPARKLAPALAAGCTTVFKPSELTPATSLRLIEMLGKILTPGLVNMVMGDPETVSETWAKDPRVRGLTFTGSTRVGRELATQNGPGLKRLMLELGGKAPFIVTADADPAEAVECLMVAKYRNNGQSCIAANEVWVHRSLADEVIARFAEASRKLRLGDPLEEGTELGPMAVPGDPERLESLVDDGAEHGAEIIRGKVAQNGNYLAPAVLIEPGDEARVWQEEVFGPVAPVRVFGEVEEVVEATNNSELGLAAYICSQDTDNATSIASRLDVGIVGVNIGTPNTPQIPFGGRKASGIGSEGGHVGLEHFLASQSIAVRQQ